MKRWAYALLLMLALAVPVAWADDEADTKKKDTAAAPKQEEEQEAKDQEAEESPILRLAEVRIDEYVVPARMINLPLPGRTRTLQEVLDNFDELAKDEKVGAVLLNLGDVSLSLADVEELRTGVAKLQKANKKVLAYLNGGGPPAYLLACAADEVVMAPTGNVILPGLGGVFPFLKGYYQMVGLEHQVLAAGRYKYPGFVNRRQPDQYFFEEFDAILDSLIGDYKGVITKGRHLSPEAVDETVDIALFNGRAAQQRGLVDTLAYYEDYRDRVLRREKLKKYRGLERGLAEVNSIQDLMEVVNQGLKRAEEARRALGPKIAVLHARGPIVDLNLGAAFASQLICRDDFIKVVDDLRKNKSIKAVVMRVDSPGGSGYASDMIWQALRQLGEAKPLVVSMGSVAGSGGYYIACPAHRIFAQPTTITGSIGVIGIFQSAWSMYNRMDFEFAELKRGERSLLGSPHRTLPDKDVAFLQDYIDDFYGVFVDRVAQTRKIPADEVRKIAEGRIYTGRDALKLGLVDELGGLVEAIEAARGMTGIPPSAELKIVHYPRPGSLGEILESFSSVGVASATDALSKGAGAARPIPFEQQLSMFARSPKPLCWMAVPAFWEPQSAWGPQSVGALQSLWGPQSLSGPSVRQLLGLPEPAGQLEALLPQAP